MIDFDYNIGKNVKGDIESANHEDTDNDNDSEIQDNSKDSKDLRSEN